MFNVIASVGSLSMAQVPEAQIYAMYICGMVSMGATLIQIMKQYYSVDSDTAMHIIMSKRCGALYRFIGNQLSLARKERKDSTQLREWATMEFEMIQQLSPLVDQITIQAFKKKFPHNDNPPDVVAKDFEIVIQGRQGDESP